MKKRQSGFTLIEIAIVLVIIGLLLGGVLKGQELITGARVRNLVQQQDGMKAAYFGFLDRYRALPGDYKAATTNITGTTQDGNADGQITDGTGAGAIKESVAVWEHLSKSGFINGSYKYDSSGETDGTNPKNPYGSYVQLVYDSIYGKEDGSKRHNLKTGAQVPVEIAAEVDRKVDDGLPNSGSFQFSSWQGGVATAPDAANCVTGSTWKATGGEVNCGGATLF